MFETLWACLLVLASLNRASRPLAFLLALKWASNYGAVWLGFWRAPALIDVAFGTVGVVWAMSLPTRIRNVLAACFVVTPLAHGFHWLLYDAGTYLGVTYYVVMLGLFSAQVGALAWPGVRSLCSLLFGLWPAPVGWSGYYESQGEGRRPPSRFTKNRPMR